MQQGGPRRHLGPPPPFVPPQPPPKSAPPLLLERSKVREALLLVEDLALRSRLALLLVGSEQEALELFA
jgi:hypothetical protein